MSQSCVHCGAKFTCGMSAGEKSCWCEELPPIMPVTDEGCLCKECLFAEIEAALKEKAGLCAVCLHAKRLTTKSKAIIFQCGRAATESRFKKFPNLPVSACKGYDAKLHAA